MRLLKKIKNLILLILALLFGFVILCALNPDLSASVGEKIRLIKGIQGGGSETSEEPLLPGAMGSLILNPDQIEISGYIIPTSDNLSVPKEVTGKNGYEPVVEDAREIDEKEADNLNSSLNVGEAGEEYSFDKLYYPYYHMLNDTQKAIYKQIYANALAGNNSFAPATPLAYSNVKNTFEAVYNDHPELFWLETEYSCKYLKSGEVIELELKYNSTKDKLTENKTKFEDAAAKIIAVASGYEATVDQEKAIHDMLLGRVEYKAGAPMTQSAYSALVNGNSVCAGYARAFQYICMQMQIPCYYCTGYAGEDHAWNIVRLPDGYTNVDVTWDDTNPATTDYFNKTDAAYSTTHVRTNLSINLPACTIYEAGNSPLLAGDDQALTEDGNEAEGAEEDNIAENEEVILPEDHVYINPNPTKPLTLKDDKNTLTDTNENADIDTIEEYYAECKAKLVAVGKGQKQFEVVITENLWNSIERIYSDDTYKTGYVNQALKELGVSNFAIQLQAKRLGNGYFRLYHNVATW